MKFLLYSDLHIRPERIDDCDHVLKEIGKIAKEEAVDYVINGGDTFHTRGLIRTSCFDVLHTRYREWKRMGLRQVILVGNHDQEDKAGEVHPLKVFNSWPFWHVIDKPTAIKNIPNTMFYPYMDRIPTLTPAEGCDAFVHWGIRGAKRNDWNVDTEGVPLESLSGFRRVFSGHYHYRSQLKNVQYIGSPLQQDFGEMGHDKGVLIYESEKEEIRFREISGTPKHYEVKVWWDDDGQEKISGQEGIKEKDFVRVEVSGSKERCYGISKEGISKKIKASRLQVHRVIQDKTFSRLKIESAEHSVGSLMERYVDFVETDLNKKKLIEVGQGILNA